LWGRETEKGSLGGDCVFDEGFGLLFCFAGLVCQYDYSSIFSEAQLRLATEKRDLERA
jgi:hypothetical protein